jgi:hypothetical protein
MPAPLPRLRGLFRAAGRKNFLPDQPSAALSGVEEHGGRQYVVLRKVNRLAEGLPGAQRRQAQGAAPPAGGAVGPKRGGRAVSDGTIRVRASLGERMLTATLRAETLALARRVYLGTAGRDPDPKLTLHRLIWGALDGQPSTQDIPDVQALIAVLALAVADADRADAFGGALAAGGDYEVDYVVTKSGANDYHAALAVTPAGVPS